MNNTSSNQIQALKLQAFNNTPLPPKPSLPDFLDPALWEQYLAYKKERKEKLSKQGIEMKFSEWAKWNAEGIDVNACIREAMANEWQGVFRPKVQKRQAEQQSVDYDDLARFGFRSNDAIECEILEQGADYGDR